MDDYQLYRGECLKEMDKIPDGSVDMVLCDLPYGTTSCKWDAVIAFEPLWAQYRRVAKKDAAVVLTACQPFTSALVMSNPKMFRYDLTWEKNKATGHLNAKKAPMRAHESVLVFCRGRTPYNPQMTDGHKAGNVATRKTPTTVYGKMTGTNTWGGSTKRYPRSVLNFDVLNNDDPDRAHPTQKPVALMEYLIRTYTAHGQTVLDNCMGSGTTGVACANTVRKFIGIEQDEKYFQAASERIKRAYEQDGLD